jgi:predicted amidohydrolase
VDNGADYVQTPEMTTLLVRSREELVAGITGEAKSPALAAFRDLARRHNIWLHVGSMAVLLESGDRVANRAFLITPAGEIAARYDKIHMFDVDLPMGESWRESTTYQPGETAILADLPWGRLGLSICYDLRFPALYTALAEAGAAFLAVPSAFTKQTGEAHWHVLQRARAIETGSFVLAAAQGGRHEDGRDTFGHSLIVDPWGRILAEGGTEPGVVIARIDPVLVEDARQRIPALAHGRRFGVLAPSDVPNLKVVQ